MKRKEKTNTMLKSAGISATMLSLITPVSAAETTNKIMEQSWFTGGVKLIEDATAAGLVIAPIAGILASIYFWARRGMAEPEEKKRWQDRAVNAMLIGVIVGLVSGLCSLITSYLTGG